METSSGQGEGAGDEKVREFSLGKPIAVAMPRIEAELAALWRRVAEEAAAGDQRRALTRACLWNLLIRVTDDEALGRARALVDEISIAVPARVLMLSTRKGATTQPLSATVEANWHAIDGGAMEIGSDEVTLTACGAAIAELAPVVRALRMPDVSTAAVWLGASPDRDCPLDREMLAGPHRVVLDSDGVLARGEGDVSTAGSTAVTAMIAELRTLAAVANRSPATDLAWLRGGAVRSLLASLFDSTDGAAALDVLSVDQVSISCRRDRLGTAALLAGWLGSRLHARGSRASAATGGVVFDAVRPDGGALQIRLWLDPASADPIGGIELECPSGHYALALADDGRSVICETPSLARKEPFSPGSEGSLWVLALGHAGRDHLYAEALNSLI